MAQPGIDHRLASRSRACAENVPDRLLVEPDEGDHDLLGAGKSADKPAGNVQIERVGDPPEFIDGEPAEPA